MNRTDIISKALQELLPQSVVNEIACFVLYDHHPRDERVIDITVCSNRGVVQEFFQRELINSILIENLTDIKEIQILRNRACDLFYLVATRNEIIIISKKRKLEIHQRIKNIYTYDLDDIDSRGQSFLKIILKDDAVPLVFDENFDHLREGLLNIENDESEVSLPIVTQLMRKLNEAKYTTKCNENKYKEYLRLRQMAAFSIYQRRETNLDDSVFKLNIGEICNALQIVTQTPEIKCCNNKIIIISSILNNNIEPITEITVLLHGSTKQSLEYTTKVFDQLPRPPYWKEINSQIDSKEEATIVTVIDFKEIMDNTKCSIDFDTVMSFTKKGKNYLLPLGNIKISALDIMGKKFDVLFDDEKDVTTLMLTILATSEKTNLCLRHVKNPCDTDITTSDIFCTHLKMESMNMDNLAIHKNSPHHILYGVMVVFEENVNDSNHIMNIQVYSRAYSQVLALIHYIYDAVPYKIITTTPEYKLTAIHKDLIQYNEKSEATDFHLNYTECVSSLRKQSEIIKDFFGDCIQIQMNHSKNTEIQNQPDLEIDVMAQGLSKYLEFRNLILEESLNGIQKLSIQENPELSDSDSSIIDYDLTLKM